MKSLTFFTALIFIRDAVSYSRGPPADKKFVCDSMKPSKNTHGQPQTDSIPYSIEIESEEVPLGSRLYLSLRSNSKEDFYKGFMIQGRNAKGEIVGVFEDSRGAKVVPCIGSNGSIGQDGADNKNKVTLLWKATEGVELDSIVTFYATVMRAIRTFWTNEPMRSVRIVKSGKYPGAFLESDGSAESEVEPESEAESEAEGEYGAESESEGESEPEGSSKSKKVGEYATCGSSKGCIGTPSNCVESSSCSVMASYAPLPGSKYRLSLTGADNRARYLALGFSLDGSMGEDLVVSCRNVGNKPQIEFSWNFGKSTSADLEKNLPTVTNQKISSVNNVLTCSFDIDSKLNVTVPGKADVVSYDFSANDYHLLVAEGPSDSSKISYHSIKTASASPVSLKAFSPIGEKSDILIKVHGVLMVISWMFCSFVGMMLGRYYKETWSNKKPLGMPIWFLGHRSLMMSVVFLSIAALVIIMIEIGGWNYDWTFLQENPHPIIGIVTFILCLVQPLMAQVRPHPGTENRWIFNWAHWFVGNSVQILAIASIFFSIDLKKAKLPDEANYVLTVFVIVSCLAHLALTGEVFASNKDASNMVSPSRKTYDFEEERMDPSEKSGGFRKILLGVYILINIILSSVIMGYILVGPGK
eukprot:TRINITY_DN6593_c0_g1_i2.p1 TRINITY_DN6593_c0_g1~~TRINITY_DN6593_c0_g1_i2.p1  ORF type:complete len:641 (-),score=120.12 TRINITY_DN6593_c0_g1_i2:200-2122(-)